MSRRLDRSDLDLVSRRTTRREALGEALDEGLRGPRPGLARGEGPPSGV